MVTKQAAHPGGKVSVRARAYVRRKERASAMKFDEPIRDQWKKRRRDCFRKLASEILDWLKEEDPEFLEEMILAAVKQGLKKSQEVAAEEKKKIVGSLGLPGLENLV